MGRSFGRFVLSASSETQGQLQSSSKLLKHFPNVDLGITVVSVLQNTRGSTLGRERAHFSENKSVRSKNQYGKEFSRKLKRNGVCFNDL